MWSPVSSAYCLVFSLLPDCFHDPVTMICLPCPVVKVSSGIIAMLPLHRRSRCSSRHFHVSSQKHADDRWRIHYIEEPERFVVFSKNNPSQQANFTGVAAACHDTISGQIYWLQKVTAIFFPKLPAMFIPPQLSQEIDSQVLFVFLNFYM